MHTNNEKYKEENRTYIRHVHVVNTTRHSQSYHVMDFSFTLQYMLTQGILCKVEVQNYDRVQESTTSPLLNEFGTVTDVRKVLYLS